MEKELALLQVCDLAKQWPNLSAIHDRAMALLMDANAMAQTMLDDRAKAKAEVDAKAAADAEAKRKALADAEAKLALIKVIPSDSIDQKVTL